MIVGMNVTDGVPLSNLGRLPAADLASTDDADDRLSNVFRLGATNLLACCPNPLSTETSFLCCFCIDDVESLTACRRLAPTGRRPDPAGNASGTNASLTIFVGELVCLRATTVVFELKTFFPSDLLDKIDNEDCFSPRLLKGPSKPA